MQCRRPRFDPWVGKIPWRRDRLSTSVFFDFPGGSDSQDLPTIRETHVQSLGGEDPLEEGLEPTPVFLLGESHGQRSLVGYSPWAHRVEHD